MSRRLSKAYLLTKVMTASRQEVIAYLYEGAIGFLHRAQEAIEKGDRARAAERVDRAIKIIIELSGTLDYRPGHGKIAMRLESIYNYLIESLSIAKVRNDAEAIANCEGILVVLHDAWRQAGQLTQGAEEGRTARLQISA